MTIYRTHTSAEFRPNSRCSSARTSFLLRLGTWLKLKTAQTPAEIPICKSPCQLNHILTHRKIGKSSPRETATAFSSHDPIPDAVIDRIHGSLGSATRGKKSTVVWGNQTPDTLGASVYFLAQRSPLPTSSLLSPQPTSRPADLGHTR